MALAEILGNPPKSFWGQSNQTLRPYDRSCKRLNAWTEREHGAGATAATRQKPLHYSEVDPAVFIPTVSATIAWLRQGQMPTAIFSHAADSSGLKAD
jgi:hypothetical protein